MSIEIHLIMNLRYMCVNELACCLVHIYLQFDSYLKNSIKYKCCVTAINARISIHTNLLISKCQHCID